MKTCSIEHIDKFLKDDYIVSGLDGAPVIADIVDSGYTLHCFDDGFVCYVKIRPNAFMLFCGFYSSAKDVFAKCKQSFNVFLNNNVKSRIFSTVHPSNKRARNFNNVFGFKFLGQSELTDNLRLYEYGGKI